MKFLNSLRSPASMVPALYAEYLILRLRGRDGGARMQVAPSRWARRLPVFKKLYCRAEFQKLSPRFSIANMESLGIDWKILIGQIVNFVILFFLLKRFAFKPFLNMLQQRKAKIEEGVKKSKEAEKSLQSARETSLALQEKGEKEAVETVKKAERLAEVRVKEIILTADREKEKIIREARVQMEREIADEKEIKEKESLEKAFAVAEKLLREKIDRDKDKKIIETVLADSRR